MIMKTNLRKMILWTIALLAISIMTTSSVNPGYDEFGMYEFARKFFVRSSRW